MDRTQRSSKRIFMILLPVLLLVFAQISVMAAVAIPDAITVSLWLHDIDYNKIDQTVKDELGIKDITKAKPEVIRKYIQIKRSRLKTAYTDHNKSFVSKFLKSENVVFLSSYAPMIIADIDKVLLSILKKEVVRVDLFDKTVPREDELLYSVPDIHAHYTRDTLNLKGDGVKVGIVENGYPDKTNSELSDRSITFDVLDSVARTRLSSHATKVTAVIVGKDRGIVPNCDVYAAAALNRTEDYLKIEWLVDQGVNVINYSAGYTDIRGTYSVMAGWIDHLGYQDNVYFVKSAGNYKFSSYQITDPGMAYNAATVGSMDDHDTPGEPYWPDDTFSSFSCYMETAGGYKPDLTAPGEGIDVAGFTGNNGTSFSAPHVSGVLAQLIQYDYALSLFNCSGKAILTAGTTHRTALDYGGYALSPYYSNQEGAGVVDAGQAYNVVSAGAYENQLLAVSQFPYTKTFTVLATGQTVRVSLAWMKENTLDTGLPLSDLDLLVYGPGGNLIAISASSNNNVELVQFVPAVSGAYSIQVSGYSLLNPNEWVSLAWYQ